MTKADLLKLLEEVPADTDISIRVVGTAKKDSTYITFDNLAAFLHTDGFAPCFPELSAKSGQEAEAIVTLFNP